MAADTRGTPNSTASSLSAKLRELGRLKHRGEEKTQRAFEITHTPDRPTRVVSPEDAPTEEECGSVIARWQLAATKTHGQGDPVSHRTLSHPRGRLEDHGGPLWWYEASDLTGLNRQGDDATTPPGSDDDGREGHVRHHHTATELVYGRNVRPGKQTPPQRSRPLDSVIHRHPGSAETQPTGQHRQRPVGTHAVFDDGRAAQAPLFAGTDGSPRSNHARSPSPALATVAGDNSLTRTVLSGSRGTYVPEDDGDLPPVDMEQLVRMEKYRRGVCPFCNKVFPRTDAEVLPRSCPFLDCQRQLEGCLEYPRRTEAEKPPPPLHKRAFLSVQPRSVEKSEAQGLDRHGRNREGRGPAKGQTQKQPQPCRYADAAAPRSHIIPSIAVEAPTLAKEEKLDMRFSSPRRPPVPLETSKLESSSGSHTIRKIWPSPQGIYDPATIRTAFERPDALRKYDREKPLPPPPIPPVSPERRTRRPVGSLSPPSAASISERHRQLYRQQQPHVASQMTATAAAKATTKSSGPLPPSSLSSLFSSPPPPSLLPSSHPHPLSMSPRSRGTSSSPTSSCTAPLSPRTATSTTPTTTATTTTSASSSSPPPPQSSTARSPRRSGEEPGTPRRRPEGPSRRGRSASALLRVDDAAFLAWKTPAGRRKFEREARERGNDADLFMDIIEQYRDGDGDGDGLGKGREGTEDKGAEERKKKNRKKEGAEGWRPGFI